MLIKKVKIGGIEVHGNCIITLHLEAGNKNSFIEFSNELGEKKRTKPMRLEFDCRDIEGISLEDDE